MGRGRNKKKTSARRGDTSVAREFPAARWKTPLELSPGRATRPRKAPFTSETRCRYVVIAKLKGETHFSAIGPRSEAPKRFTSALLNFPH